MNIGRMERHFWCFALCRSPNGWAINFGSWMITFGAFTSECKAAREASEVKNERRI